MSSIYGAEVMVDLNKSPYIAEMEALVDKDIPDGWYFDPDAFDESIGDLTKVEARLVRLILRLVHFDKNYLGIIELSSDVCTKFAVDKEFSSPTLYTALKGIMENVQDGKKPLITQFKPRSRLYWVNPAIAGKKSLIEKFKNEKAEEVTIEEDE